MTLDEYAAHVAQFSTVVWADGIPWLLEKRTRVLDSMAMPHKAAPVDRAKVRHAMRETGARIARWSDAWDTEPCDWWRIGCDDPDYDLEKLTPHGRRDTRRGLKRSEVKQVTPAWLAENAYETYVAASRYYRKDAQIITRERFADWMMQYEKIGTEAWACFVHGNLAAYATCDVVDDAVSITTGRFDRAYSKARPSNALFYTLTRHYLVERGLRYVTGGQRVMLHKTQVQDFLERMGYRRVYCPLRLELNPLATLAVWSHAHRWGKYLGLGRFAPNMMAGLQTVVRLAEIAKSCEDVPADVDVARGATEGPGRREVDE